MICCLCKNHIEPVRTFDGKVVWDKGNDPWPLATTGRCCTRCDEESVLPARLNIHIAQQRGARKELT